MDPIIGGAPAAPIVPDAGTAPIVPEVGAIKYPEGFAEEFHGNESVTKFWDKEKGDFNHAQMMTSLIHAQKMVGGDKLLVPNKDSSADDWKTVYNKLGLPERENYKLGIEGVDEVADEMTKGFIDKAHELGVLPQQAKGIVEYFNEAQKLQGSSAQQDADDANTTALNNLKKDWSGSYEDNIHAVNEVVDKIFTDEEKKLASDAGMFSDPLFVKMMHTVSTKIGDDQTLSGQAPRIGGLEGEQALRDEYLTVTSKMMTPEGKSSPALQRRLEHVLQQAAKKGVEVYR